MVKRQCPVCGVIYEADPHRLKHGRQTTCSRKCSYSLRTTNRTTSVTGPCGVCGKLVTRPPSRVALSKTNVMLCSSACAYRARSLGLVGREVITPYNIPDEVRQASSIRRRKQNALRKAEGRYACSDETKAKLSLATAKAIAEGRIPRVSQLELRVGDVLKQLGVRATGQYRLRGDHGRFAAVLDYFLLDSGTAVEVNGTFWHADPREYPSGPVYASQHRTASRYQTKIKLLRDRGIPLIEIWELDFNADPEVAVRSALGKLMGSSC